MGKIRSSSLLIQKYVTTLRETVHLKKTRENTTAKIRTNVRDREVNA
jgi:hypothetical protein